MTNIRMASAEEFEKIRAFYHKLIDMMAEAEFKPGWEKEVYPSDTYLINSLENGTLWVCELESQYIASMIVNHESNEGYRSIGCIMWDYECWNGAAPTMKPMAQKPAVEE